jgi:hypothetical protein
MRVLHLLAHLMHKWKHNQRSDRVADERSDHQDQSTEDYENAVQAHTLDAAGDGLGNGVQQSGRVDRLSEREAASCEDDDGPEEVVEVFLCEDAGAEEEDERDDGHDAHVAEDVFELVTDAPQDDGENRNNTDEPLNARELVFERSDRNNGGATTWLEGDKKQYPDEQD